MDQFDEKARIEEALSVMWEKAYRANPSVYEKDGKIVVGFALTEKTLSLFPLVAANQWKIEGKTVDLWFISIVSLTKDCVIGTIEYREAMKRLLPHVIAMKDDWALIRGLTYEQMDALFDGLPKDVV